MKRAIVYAACIFIVSTAAAAPGSKLVQRFSETFPNAKNVKWVDDKAGYFVSFTQNGNFNKVFYNKGGNFVYSLKYFSGDALPVNIIMTLNVRLSVEEHNNRIDRYTGIYRTGYSCPTYREYLGYFFAIRIIEDSTPGLNILV